MINKLTYDQVANTWDIVKYAIVQALPPIVDNEEEVSNNILSAIMLGKLECWAVYQKDEEEKIILEGIITTAESFDDLSKTKNLIIYTAYGYAEMTLQTWKDTIEKLKAYAKSRGCFKLIAYTKDESVENLGKFLGASVDYSVISFDL